MEAHAETSGFDSTWCWMMSSPFPSIQLFEDITLCQRQQAFFTLLKLDKQQTWLTWTKTINYLENHLCYKKHRHYFYTVIFELLGNSWASINYLLFTTLWQMHVVWGLSSTHILKGYKLKLWEPMKQSTPKDSSENYNWLRIAESFVCN